MPNFIHESEVLLETLLEQPFMLLVAEPHEVVRDILTCLFICAGNSTLKAFHPLQNLEHLDENGTIVYNWFEDTYIGRARRRVNGKRLQLFPCTLWNVHERILLYQEKTNNSAEVAHRKLQHKLGMCHPPI